MEMSLIGLMKMSNERRIKMKILIPIIILCASIAVNTLAALMIVDIINHFIDPYIILGIGFLLFISTLFFIKR